ncbi:MAG TPA: hypothetical protein PLD25_29805 [Chloroflexota bacterium]|nr:hypothetical protein [Chloroflexota bacterium]HUM67326.1 hypothetical protein [Chloroflexota bacterium]
MMNTKRILLVVILVSLLLAAVATVWAQSGDLPLFADRSAKLTGAWLIDVAESNGGLPPFQALQTFHGDGTFTETSSLLGGGEEGPAHGVWQRLNNNQYSLTFYLFVFDENGEAAGMVRVRAAIQMVDNEHLTAQTAVDFIEPDGTIIPDIDGGPFTGTRLKVEAAP